MGIAVYLGLGTIGVSLLSAVVDIYGPGWRVPAAAAVVAIVLRDVTDVAVNLKMQSSFMYAASSHPIPAHPGLRASMRNRLAWATNGPWRPISSCRASNRSRKRSTVKPGTIHTTRRRK